jgi:hypothetical protein
MRLGLSEGLATDAAALQIVNELNRLDGELKALKADATGAE